MIIAKLEPVGFVVVVVVVVVVSLTDTLLITEKPLKTTQMFSELSCACDFDNKSAEQNENMRMTMDEENGQ